MNELNEFLTELDNSADEVAKTISCDKNGGHQKIAIIDGVKQIRNYLDWAKIRVQKLKELDPAFLPKCYKFITKYYEKRQTLNLKFVKRDMVKCFCEVFPEDPLVKKHLEKDTRLTRQKLYALIQAILDIIDLGTYMELYGITDKLIFENLKKNIESNDRRVSNTAITIALKLKRYLKDYIAKEKDNTTINIQHNDNKQVVNMPKGQIFVSGAKNKEQAIKDLMTNYEKLKAYVQSQTE